MGPPALYVGTSGFAFDDWRGPVYPERLPRSQWLTYYEPSLGFNALEINYTYYQMPSHRTITGLVRKTTPDFRFAIKAHRRLTHDAVQGGGVGDNPSAFREFREGMRPLAESGKLACVLAQFPYAFQRQPAHRDYLDLVMDRLADLHLVVEFRHQSWAEPSVFEQLRQRQVGWCAVDEPPLPRLMPWVAEATSDLGYVRLHGRNAAAWFGTSTAERDNYSYNDSELRELAGKLGAFAGNAKAIMVLLNNCHAGSAARDALRLRDLLKERGWDMAGRLEPQPSQTLFSLEPPMDLHLQGGSSDPEPAPLDAARGCPERRRRTKRIVVRLPSVAHHDFAQGPCAPPC